MKIAKKKTERCMQMTEKQFHNYIKDGTELAVKRTLLLVVSYLMDDFNYDADKICETFDGIMRYVDAANDHLITFNQVSDIIYEHTGMRIRW